MNRRRFFPAQMTQTEPGKVVDLEVQLRPEGAGGACACDLLGPALFPDLVNLGEDQTQPPAYLQPSVSYFYAPRREGWRCTGAYVQIPQEWEFPLRLRGVLAGATLCDVRWSWALTGKPVAGSMPGYDYEAHWGGVELAEENGTLAIEILGGTFFDPLPWWAELRITATCAGEPAGELVVRPGNDAWDPSRLPPIQ